MPPGHPLKHYVPVALIIVAALVGIVIAKPQIWFALLDPGGAIDRQREQTLVAIGSADAPLTQAQAEELFARFHAGERAASTALVHQDLKHGLPDAFVRDLENRLIYGADDQRSATYLIERLASQRRFDERLEQAVAASVRTPTGGVSSQHINLLGSIGAHRRLDDSSLAVLLDVASRRSSSDRTALGAIEPTATRFGLPDWALDQLAQIADTRPGQVRNDAVRVIAAAGEQERATAIVNTPGTFGVDANTVRSLLTGKELPALVSVLQDNAQTMDLRIGALDQIGKTRDQPEQTGRALTYALSSSEDDLRLAAVGAYADWGRMHPRHIDVDWPGFCARAFADDNEAMRSRIAREFRFVPFSNTVARDAFLLEMLEGGEEQQLTTLRAVNHLRQVSQPLQQAVAGLTGSANPDIAATASMLTDRYRPRGALERLGPLLSGALFWVLLLLPALVAVGFQTYFVARGLQNRADGVKSKAPTLVAVVWFILSLALGMALFLGVMAVGHGGADAAGIYTILAIINGVYFGIGWLLRLWVRRGAAIPNGMDSQAEASPP